MNNNLYDSNSNNFMKDQINKRLKAIKNKKPIEDVVLNFFKSTNIPYMTSSPP